jgi:hypothetical protein
MRMLKIVALSSGIAAGMFGLTALASTAYAQAPYWQGAPNATGPDASNDSYGSGPTFAPSAPFYQDESVGSGSLQPYWLGAPRSTGPSE